MGWGLRPPCCLWGQGRTGAWQGQPRWVLRWMQSHTPPNQVTFPHPPAHPSTALPSSGLSPKALCSPKQLGHPITSCLEPPAPYSLPQTCPGRGPVQPLPAGGAKWEPEGARAALSATAPGRTACGGEGHHGPRGRLPRAALLLSPPPPEAAAGGDVGPSSCGLRGRGPPT